MAYKIRAILDVEEDVIRDIVVKKTISLESLHFTIAKSFGFNGQEMASFYKADTNWEQGIEIPLCNMTDEDNGISMDNCFLNDFLKNKGDKLIYVYDFLSMWTFFIELKEKKSRIDEELSKTVFSIGNVPEEAPEKEFTAEKLDDDIDIFDDENNFDSLDDLDSNYY